jgi:PBSX family phage terminase large subunit
MDMRINMGKPSPKQEMFLKAKAKVVIFGGSRGGGKSWSVRCKAIILSLAWPGIKIMIVRKTYPELTANHIKPLKVTLRIGQKGSVARYNDSKKEITFKNGSTILFGYCDTDKDIDRYQGTEVDVLFIDEATHHSEEIIKKFMACVRGVNNFPKRIYLTCNPGGKGHGYIKRIAIDRRFEEGENPEDYVFIQSLVTDNKALMREQPDYIKQLEALPPKLRQAWLEGRWDVFSGAFFEEFRCFLQGLICVVEEFLLGFSCECCVVVKRTDSF